MLSFSLPFPIEYGYIVGVLGGSLFMNAYLTFLVMQARNKYGVDYPHLYAPTGHKFEEEFNNVQRAHQNALESYSFVMVQMCTCGLVSPITSAVCGSLFCFGRVIYGYSYAIGGSKGRILGRIISHLGDFPLIVMSFKIAFDTLTK